jgi:hypothetical protein
MRPDLWVARGVWTAWISPPGAGQEGLKPSITLWTSGRVAAERSFMNVEEAGVPIIGDDIRP